MGFNPRARDGRETFSYHRVILTPSFNPRARDGRENPNISRQIP